MENEFQDGIFVEEKEVFDNMRESAEALGINPDLVAPEQEQVRYAAKKNCKFCYGRGKIEVCFSPSKPKIFHRNKAEMGERSKKRGLPSMGRRKIIFGIAPGNDLHEEWSEPKESDGRRQEKIKGLLGKVPDHSNSATSRPEPQGYKERNTSIAFCRCVRAVS